MRLQKIVFGILMPLLSIVSMPVSASKQYTPMLKEIAQLRSQNLQQQAKVSG